MALIGVGSDPDERRARAGRATSPVVAGELVEPIALRDDRPVDEDLAA
jgi:hypothetical protein